MTVKLRPFQAVLEQEVYAAWADGAVDVLAVAATGSGKTVLFSDVMRKEAGPSVAIAHRQELVAQISLALARNGVRHKVIGPPAVARVCGQLHREEIGYSMVDPNSRTAVAGVDTLIRMNPKDAWFAQVRLVVHDECFPAGTPIRTPEGDRRIEAIRPGDTVSAFNEETGLIEPRRVVRLFKNLMPKRMMRVSVAHHVLKCTLGHPFYTRRGWVEAGRLTPDDEVLLHGYLQPLRSPDYPNERSSTLPLPQKRLNLLQPNLRVRVPDDTRRETDAAGSRPHSPSDTLHNVWATCGLEQASLETVGENRAGVLRGNLCERILPGRVLGGYGKNEPCSRFCADENEQPDGKPGYPCPNGRNAQSDRARSDGSGREWARGHGSGKTLGSHIVADRRGLSTAVCDQDGRSYGVEPGEGVQTGQRLLAAEIGDRSGRLQPSGATQGFGRQKGRVLTWARLGSLEVYERPDIQRAGSRAGSGYVYNIEVEGLHTYIANSVVVHNCHHVLRGNKWGRARTMFPAARGLHVTATPGRLDCKGLGRHADGFIDRMITAPSMRDLINMGYLTDYRIVCAESDVDVSSVTVGSSGEFVQAKLREAVHRSKSLVGDVVAEYKARAMGKLGITFAVDVESATEVARAFRDAGVPAQVVTSDTPDALRADILRKFRRRELLQLVNVDLFGEGFDLPAIEVVSMARHTASFILFAQMFGRMLRLMVSPELSAQWGDFTDAERRAHIAASGKPRGLLIDHVGNLVRHGGPPDKPRAWSLDRGERRAHGVTDAIPYRVCANPMCAAPYERVLSKCPHCGTPKPDPAGRATPEQVDGNLFELSDEAAAAMRGEQARIDGAPVLPWGAAPAVQGAVKKRHWERQQAQGRLRTLLGWWTGLQDAMGYMDPAEQMRRFWFSYGVDVGTACTLGATEADTLAGRISETLTAAGVTIEGEKAA